VNSTTKCDKTQHSSVTHVARSLILVVRPMQMKPIYKDHGFSTYVKKHFDFLITEYGFLNHPRALGYVKGDLELEFYQGKGEMEVVFFVRRENEIFKPYVSRSFDVIDIAYAQRKVDWPSDLPKYVVSLEGADKYLDHYSKLVKELCKDQLSGDFSLFEKIHLERRKNA
jgi:hypothetical protein